MKRIIVALVIILALLLVPSPATAASGIKIVDRVGDGTWIGNTWKVNIYPGQAKATTLTLYNSSNDLAKVDISITPNSLDNANLLFELDKLAFTIPGKSYADVTLAVKASGSVAPGTYYSELKIEATSPPSVIPPSVTTIGAWSLPETGAFFWGILNNMGSASSVEVYFEWGKTESYGFETAHQTLTSAPNFIFASVNSLIPNTTYHVRAVAVGDGTSYGKDRVFRTMPWVNGRPR